MKTQLSQNETDRNTEKKQCAQSSRFHKLEAWKYFRVPA